MNATQIRNKIIEQLSSIDDEIFLQAIKTILDS